MPKPLIKPGINRIYKQYILGVVNDLSVRSKFVCVKESEKTQCPNCVWDAAQKAGSGKYKTGGPQPFTGKVCPVCKNVGQLSTHTETVVKASVVWGKGDGKTPDTVNVAGVIPVGHARIKADVTYFPTIMDASYYLVDGVRCQRLRPPIKRGLQSYVICEMMVKRDD